MRGAPAAPPRRPVPWTGVHENYLVEVLPVLAWWAP
ncbi:Uncharacterised protein [Bordetella pertussis]|nr:Uncharacterised protein [Bordetella pertussis]